MTQSKMPINCIGIVGLGLIGGSLGLDLQSLGYEVRGLVHRSSTVNRAEARGLAQVVSTDPNILNSCDLVILALPLDKLINPESALIQAIPKNAVITDVGSVKVPVLKTWEVIHPHFIGSHPMAGTAESGIEAGQLGLFNKQPWVATPNTYTDPQALEIVHQLVLKLGSQWVIAEAEKHDEAVALISHLPVLISAALLKTLGKEQDQDLFNLSRNLASSGFADTTRVGGGNPELGTAMASKNSSAILRALTSYTVSYTHLTLPTILRV